MAVATTQSWQEHTSDGSTAYFPFNFNYDTTRPGTIVVGKRTADNTYSVVDASNYELIPNAAGDGGQIRFIQNPSGSQIIDDIPPAGTIIRIERVSVDTSSATWQIGLEMSELVNLFDRLFRLVQENKNNFANVIKTFETQHNISLYELLSEHDNHLLYWDNTTQTLTPTDFPKEDVVRATDGMFLRISTDTAGNPYLEWSLTGTDNWHSVSDTAVEALSKINTHLADKNNPHETSMSKLTDTEITNLSANQFIMFDGMKWKNVFSSATVYWGQVLGNITDQTDLMNKFTEYVRTDGSSTMTGVLKMRASESFKGAIAPSWDGVGFFKLNDNDSVTLMASMEETDGLTPATNNKYNIGKSAYRWKDLYLSGKAYVATINNGADISVPTTSGTMALTSDIAFKSTDVELTTLASGQFLMYDGSKWINSTHGYANTSLSNLTSTGANIANWSSNVSNCIIEIPQDINLELSSGTLTLKAGSKVYVPNGSDTFDVYTVPSDLTNTPSMFSTSSNRVYVLGPNKALTPIDTGATYIYSGTTAPTTFDENGRAYWYDTTNNVIKRTQDSGTTWVGGYSFPIAIVDITNGVGVSNIDQVFNGFGYIGSTIFALPGVKGLMPSGRNADGTLKSVSFAVSAVRTFGYNITGAFSLIINQNDMSYVDSAGWKYDASANINTAYGTKTLATKLADVTLNSGVITSFEPVQAFHAVDYSDYQELKDDVPKQIATLLQTIYPVGSIYIGTQNTCPMGALISGSTWVLVSSGRALWTGNGTNGNTTIAAGLPNITGIVTGIGDVTVSGAFERGPRVGGNGGGDGSINADTFDASRSSSIYGASTTVQPPAYVVNVWRRTA